jgi:hypothetical protein
MRSRQRLRAARLRRARRTTGIAGEKVARANSLRIDDVEDEDEDIGDAKAIDDCDPQTAPADDGWRDNATKGPYSTWRKNPPADFLQMQEAESRCATRG